MTVTPNDLLSNALAYAARGWPVLPLRGKTPLVPRGLHNATTDAETIRAWWQTWPDANIGIRTGQPGGLYVIDVDGDKGNASLAELVATHGDVPATLVNVTGNGHHYCFTAARPIRCSQSAIAPGIDTRGEDGYIVAPPSIHPTTGQAYAWADVNAEPAELPDWLRPPERPATPAVTHPPRIRQAASDTDRTARASAYLATMGAAVEGAGGHSRLYAAATAMAWGFDLGRDGACDILWREFNPRCAPPWDYANPGQRREFERKVDQSLAGNHDNPRGWLADSPGASMGLGTVEHGAGIVEAILATEAAKAQPATAADLGLAPAITAPKPVPAMPAHLLQPPGHIGTLCAWMNATAWKPQPVLALANALAFWGAVVGRKVRDEYNNRTNLYTIGVAHSCAGKEHSRKCVKRLVSAAGERVRPLLAGEDIGSDAGLQTAIAANPACLFQLDEIGHFIAGTRKKTAAQYIANVPVILTKLYSSASTTYNGRELAGSDRVDIEQPNACVYGTTNPHTLYGSIASEQIRDGFLGRLLVFQTDDDPDPTGAKSTPPPAGIVHAVGEWFTRTVDPPAGVDGNLDPHLTAWQITVPTEPEAESIFRDFREDSTRRRRALMHADTGLDALWGRAEENARKVALTLASSCGYEGLVIAPDNAAYACELVGHVTGRLVSTIEANVADSEHGRIRQAIRAYIARREATTKTDLARAFRSETPRDRTAALTDLVDAGEVIEQTQSTKGRPAIVYRAAA